MKINAKHRILLAYNNKSIDDMLQFMDEFYLTHSTYDSSRKKIDCFLEIFDVSTKDIVDYLIDNIDFIHYGANSINDIDDAIYAVFHSDYRFMISFIVKAYPAIARSIIKQYAITTR